MSRWIGVAGQILRFAAGLGLVGVALRFVSSNIERVVAADGAANNHVVFTQAAPFMSGRAAAGTAGPLASALALGSSPALAPTDLQQLGLSPPSATASGSEQSGATRPGGAPALVRLALVVSAGPARSEVFVNGSRKGHTPFIGELMCRLDDQVRVDVVPPRGMPLTFKRPCVQGTLSLK